MIVAGNEVDLKEPPTDGISNVTFGPWSDSLLLSSSWDSVSIPLNIKSSSYFRLVESLPP